MSICAWNWQSAYRISLIRILLYLFNCLLWAFSLFWSLLQIHIHRTHYGGFLAFAHPYFSRRLHNSFKSEIIEARVVRFGGCTTWEGLEVCESAEHSARFLLRLDSCSPAIGSPCFAAIWPLCFVAIRLLLFHGGCFTISCSDSVTYFATISSLYFAVIRSF